MLTLFRGLAVPKDRVDAVMDDIRTNGFKVRKDGWPMKQNRPPNPADLFEKLDLTRADTRDGDHIPEVAAVCACGDQEGAAHYAWRHNRNLEDDTPVLVAFQAPVEAVAVDGKDLLYTVFGRGVPDRAGPALAELFGPVMLRYAEKAWGSADMSYRMAMCDLAIHDPEVVLAHHANRTVIGGKVNLVFRSAFTVMLPVESSAIIKVFAPYSAPAAEIPQVLLQNLI
ncbi:hypothetical protein ACSD7O_17455 [Methylorubrum extorquens]|uniref:hypothetical protein n=1 Tax=Methylorubrum extorquens TaxID=408 RepID=UPI003F626C50